MLPLPMTDFMRNYCAEHNITFTDRQRATIFWDYQSLSLARRMAALEEIAATTEEIVLREEINARLQIVNAALEKFRDNEDGTCIYQLTHVKGGLADWRTMGCFRTWAAAYEAGADRNKGGDFCIRKLPLDAPKDREGDVHAVYNCCGQLCGFNVGGEDLYGHLDDSWPYTFEVQLIPLPNPFDRGDIVKFGDRLAVVETAQEDWKKYMEYGLAGDPGYDTYRAAAPEITELTPAGDLITHCVCPLCLEAVDNWPEKTEWELMQCAGDLLRGQVSADFFLYFYKKNKDRIARQKASIELEQVYSGKKEGTA